MPHSHTDTVNEDEELDICPTCDFECTCKTRPARLTSIVTVLSASSSTLPSQHHQNNHHQHQQHTSLPSLKIKLTVPASMLARRRTSPITTKKSKRATEVMSHIASEEDRAAPASSTSPPKRRGRPPRHAALPRDSNLQKPGNKVGSSSQKCRASLRPESHTRKDKFLRSTVPKLHASNKPKTKSTIIAKASKSKKKRVTVSDPECSDREDDDADSAQFPTFIPASDLSSSLSSDSESDSSESDSDASIQEEEETFILADESHARDKTRVRRELFGEETQRKSPHNDWVIRPRQKSVGASDVEMDVDTDEATTGEEEDEEEVNEDDEDEEESDGQNRGAGWSDEEESSIDADLFFANLSSGSSDEADDHAMAEDTDAPSGTTEPTVPPRLHLEVIQGWDGQLVFTNGLKVGQALLDMEFEASATQLLAESSASASQESDVGMQTSDGADGEYEDDDGDLDESDGETTEEELVGPDGLPTARAMMLFKLPPSISTINPLSTVRSAATSPGPSRTRRRAESTPIRSPTPADVLAGRVFFWDDDDFDGSVCGSGARSPTLSRGGVPLMGHFDRIDDSFKTAVIGGSKKDVPSPFPRRTVARSHSRMSSLSGLSKRGRSFSRTTSLPLRGSSLVSEKQMEDSHMSVSPEPATIPIGLDDVLESSFLDSETSETENALSDSGPRKQQHSINRWDIIPVSAFRQTRDTAVAAAAASASPWPEAALHAEGLGLRDPMGAPASILWKAKETASTKRHDGITLDVSPALLPRDGDPIPTHGSDPSTSAGVDSTDSPSSPCALDELPKVKKEGKRDKKMKRKSLGIVQQKFQHHPHHQPQHHHHHHHQHHANKKSRSSGALQRTSFVGPTSSVNP